MQISDENLHHVREVWMSVSGQRTSLDHIIFARPAECTSEILAKPRTILLWYGERQGITANYQALYLTKRMEAERCQRTMV